MAIKKAVNGDDQEKKKGSEVLPYYKLFSFADRYDILMMFIGTVSSIVSGLVLPLLVPMLGQVVDSIGRFENSDLVNKVRTTSKIAAEFIYYYISQIAQQ
ncbi:hypothetical protein C5167_017924 [Papaver somniferum]|uniref:ABC transmembrane type-1 domain-containing protein n=1 Tax=Papaver somniferum TaxID=3469 RepID=A0A4Y7IKT7_PAPSO|nr:hypothetical protein C5167_017924 [Papaver somniferum]